MSDNRHAILNPPVGISHVTQSIEDLYSSKLVAGQEVVFHPAAQPNSFPHLGTVTTLAATFGLARRLRDTLGIRPRILFWSLENAPAEIIDTALGQYYRTLGTTLVSGRSKAEIHMDSFHFLLDKLSDIFDVSHRVVSYREFQADPEVRSATIEMIGRQTELAPLLCPSERRFKVRFACPTCGYARKLGGTPVSSESTEAALVYTNECFSHGRYSAVLSPDSTDLFDINTPVRALTREIVHINRAMKHGGQNMMSDGADWAHYAPINIEALSRLGFDIQDMPLRFFAPVILDWSGAKLAKSAQVGSTAYANTPQHFVDFEELRSSHSDRVLDVLADEVTAWLSEPKKIFRSYSIEYMAGILERASQ